VSDREILTTFGQILTERRRRADMSQKGKELVDGRGAERVAKIILSQVAH
jgi:UDP-N-acetylglucosamine 2-epimerase